MNPAAKTLGLSTAKWSSDFLKGLALLRRPSDLRPCASRTRRDCKRDPRDQETALPSRPWNRSSHEIRARSDQLFITPPVRPSDLIPYVNVIRSEFLCPNVGQRGDARPTVKPPRPMRRSVAHVVTATTAFRFKLPRSSWPPGTRARTVTTCGALLGRPTAHPARHVAWRTRRNYSC
jgi:hypothetical protein